MKWKTRLGKTFSIGGAWTATTLTLGLTVAACLTRPVGQQPPTTKVNFTSTVSQQAVDKVDLLFAIDNSASMADKQVILADAVPDLINGLLKPNCVDAEGKKAAANADGSPAVGDPTISKEKHYGCPTGYDPEFKPVIDMHIGIVSSSMGNFGGDVCPQTARNNDQGHLIAFGTDRARELAKPSNFLSWFPQAEENNDAKRHPEPQNPIRDIGSGDPTKPQANGLIDNFRDLVIGTGQDGCGLEAQLESFYRFLIQPDPWDVIKLDGAQQADLGEGVDSTVLAQRADFLRPDSLVAIIMLTDEDDSSADPLAIGGQGYLYMSKKFPNSSIVRSSGEADGTTAPRGTTKCATDPGHPDCTSCGFKDGCNAQDPACQRIKQDKNCTTSGLQGRSGKNFDGFFGPEDDALNVRFHRMKERYGVDPQYPIKRYVDGLTKFKVPDRKAEHLTKVNEATGRREIAAYTSTPKCTNPLFAAKLPRGKPGEELCALPRGTRSPDLVFFAVVGGVPNELLYPEGYAPDDPEKNRVTSDKWIKILGRDPLNFNYDGIDPHMIQSVAPRAKLKGGDAARGDLGDDPIHGREWNTQKTDLQYACSFDLPSPRSCAGTGVQSCDCNDTTFNNPLCTKGTDQVKAKAYPTIREFEVVRALGDQGIAASLCPLQLKDKQAPTYGYRPAVAAIIDRLKNALTTQCLPQKLVRDNEGLVPCLVLAQLGEETDTCEGKNLQKPDDSILKVFLEQQKLESGNVGDGGLDLSRLPVCVLDQRKVARGETCRDETNRVWCYVENDPANKKTPAGRCPQALIFSGGTADLAGARFSLQCIQQFAAGEAAKDTSKQ
jgi:hypothetical protein